MYKIRASTCTWDYTDTEGENLHPFHYKIKTRLYIFVVLLTHSNPPKYGQNVHKEQGKTLIFQSYSSSEPVIYQQQTSHMQM